MIRRPVTLLWLLTGLNLLNYLDRFVLAAVLPRVEKDLGLSHFVAGALATVFLLGYFLTSPVFGTLADRGARKGLLALGVAVWSVATIASGVVTSAWGLVIARAIVGVGEASYATIAPTLIDDVAPPERRAKWLALFYAATPIGSAIGYLVGGFVEVRWGWRHAFYVAGGPGLALAALCLIIREPARNLDAKKPDVLGSIATLARVRLYRVGVLGYCAYTFAIGGFAYWAPSFLHERYGLDLGAANFRFGLLTVLGGALGTFLGGWMADRGATRALAAPDLGGDAPPYRKADPPPRAITEEARDRAFVVANLRVCAVGSAIGAPLAVLCFLAPSAGVFFLVVFFCETALFLSSSPINGVLLRSVPPALRAGAMALSIFAIHLLGDLWSPPLVGALADAVPIQWAMMALPVAIGASAWIWWVRGAGRNASA